MRVIKKIRRLIMAITVIVVMTGSTICAMATSNADDTSVSSDGEVIVNDDGAMEGQDAINDESYTVNASAETLAINEKNFPDKYFREHLSQYYDKDGNGYMDPLSVTGIGFNDNNKIKDLTGIENFTNLESFSVFCCYNLSGTVNLSKCKNLNWLSIDNDNKIKYILPDNKMDIEISLESTNGVLDFSLLEGLDYGKITDDRFDQKTKTYAYALSGTETYFPSSGLWWQNDKNNLNAGISFFVESDDKYRITAFLSNKYKAVAYTTHVQSYGWQYYVGDGTMAGTSGESKRLESIMIKLDGYANLGVQYTTHCQTYGWLPWSADGEENGTTGEAKRLEAIKIQLTGADKDKYDIYYRVHAQSYGWLGWAKNGEPSGTAGYGKRLEGIQIVVVKKGDAAPGLNYAGVDGSSSKYSSKPYIAKTNETITIPGDANAPIISYKTHVQTYGWQKWVTNGQMSGTSGESKRLEGINIKVTNCPYEGDIVYTTHVQKYGWKDGKPEADKSTWKKNGEMSGTNGEAKRLEAICIALTGEMSEHYDIYYRVHAQTFGWLGWAKNGEESGTAGYAKRLEGIQIVLVPKGGAAPADNYGGITSKDARPFISK